MINTRKVAFKIKTEKHKKAAENQSEASKTRSQKKTRRSILNKELQKGIGHREENDSK